MATKVYYSNQLSELMRQLSCNIRNSPCGIFVTETIVTQTAGMKQWLAVEMAKKENNGVLANFSLVNQDEFLYALYEALTGSKVRCNMETTKWIIYNLLGSDEFRRKTEFQLVVDYYEDDDLKRIQLAARITGLIDQYQMYRETLIDAWESGRQMDQESVTETWQKWLWEKLSNNGHFYSRYSMKRQILELLDNEQNLASVRKTFPVLNFFANSIYTAWHLQIFKRLAAVIPVNHFMLFPSVDFNTTFENELLICLGANASEMSELLRQDSEMVTLAVPPAAETLLGRVQKQIFENRRLKDAEKLPDDVILDNSIQITSAYTEAREVEILYNYLLNLISRNKGLKPTDILVVATDIDRYAPYIMAVFSNAPYPVPYTLSGVSKGKSESVLHALTRILDFEEEDFTAENVIGLLESRPISARFGLNDTSVIRALIEKANIRFGWEGRRNDETRYVSWEYGLRKLAYGYAMLTDESIVVPGEDESLYPFIDIEGRSGMDLFRVSAFAEELWKTISAKKIKRTLAEWEMFIRDEVFERMILAENSDKDDLSIFYKQFRRLDEAKLIMPDVQLDFRTFYPAFRESILEESGKMGFNSGKVTFSSHIPAKGLPARVIAFLGLDNGAFPRKDRFVSYDLIPNETRIGDRSKKACDKQLFLDVLLSAKENIYLSYIGRNARENSEMPPSIVLDELMDYLESLALHPAIVREKLVVGHPLHGFSGKYGPQNDRLFTYLYGKEVLVENILLEMQTDPDQNPQPEITEIKLIDLIGFYRSPIKWFYQRILGISFEEKEEQLPESEVFDLNKLDRWILKNEMLDLELTDPALVEIARDRQMKSGRLPLATFSKIETDSLLIEIQPVKSKKNQLTNGRTEEHPACIITLGSGVKIIGSPGGVYGNDLIAHTFSSNLLKDKVAARIKYLVLTAAGYDISVHFLSKEGADQSFTPVSKADALNSLEVLANHFISGNRKILLITLQSAENYMANVNLPEAYRAFITEANGNVYSGLPADPYLQKAISDGLFLDLSAFEENLTRLSPHLIKF